MARDRKVSSSNRKDAREVRTMNKKKYTRTNSTKNQRRGKEIADSALRLEESTSNPYAWYANFPNYAKDVANLAFGVPVGQALYLNDGDWVSNAGILSIYYCPSVGVSEDLTSPINRQAVRFYTYLRSVQRAAASYDAADVMMYLLGIDQLYAYWAYMRKIYGIAQLFTPYNKYLPKMLLQANGISEAIVGNLADFRAYINRFALSIGKFAMPNNFDITQRHMWMNTGLYTDAKSTRAQIYQFVPAWFYQWDNTVTSGSQLTGQQFQDSTNLMNATNLKTLEDLVDFGEALLQNFNNDEDTMMISGDLLRAYGEQGLMHVEETPDNLVILPIYDEVVLSQIENAIFAGTVRNGTSSVVPGIKITQDPSVNNGAIIFKPLVTMSPQTIAGGSTPMYVRNYPGICANTMLNCHHDNPSPEEITEMTRLVVKAAANTAYAAPGGTGSAVQLTTCGSEIPLWFMITRGGRSNPNSFSNMVYNSNTLPIDASTNKPFADGTTNLVDLISTLMQFDWAPMLYTVLSTNLGASPNLQTVAGDVDNFTVATRTQINLINESVMLSLLDTPQFSAK